MSTRRQQQQAQQAEAQARQLMWDAQDKLRQARALLAPYGHAPGSRAAWARAALLTAGTHVERAQDCLDGHQH